MDHDRDAEEDERDYSATGDTYYSKLTELWINEPAYGYLCRTAARGRLTAAFDLTSVSSVFELGNYFLTPSDFIFSRIASFMYSAIDL